MDRAKPLILVVEDDALLRLYVVGLFEEHGFGVLEPRTPTSR
jgi:CheY-like chemotaxis protein